MNKSDTAFVILIISAIVSVYYFKQEVFMYAICTFIMGYTLGFLKGRHDD